MSNNIYDILGKLSNLTPKQETKQEPTQVIYESVDPKGSILAGVTSIEAKLAKQLAEAKAKPDFLDVDKDGNKKETFKKALKDKKSQVEESEMTEVAAPGQEAWIKKNKQHFIDQYGKDKGLSVLYATAWKRHHAANESAEQCSECGQPMESCGCEHTNEGADGFEFPQRGRYGYKMGTDNPVAYGQGHYSEGLTIIDKKTGETVHINDFTYFDQEPDQEELKYWFDNPEGEPLDEGEWTDLGGGRRQYKGSYGTEYQGDSDEEDEEQRQLDKGTKGRGRPRKHAKKAPKTDAQGNKLGRGRPKKVAEPFTSKTSKDASRKLQDIFIGKAPKGAQPKGRVHRISEGINYRKMAEEVGMTLEEMIECLSADMATFKDTGHMSEMLRDCMEVYSHGKKQIADEAIADEAVVVPSPTDVKLATPAYQRKAAAQPGSKDWMINQGDLDQHERESPTTRAGLEQRKKDLGLEEELNELARLAGLEVASEAKDYGNTDVEEAPEYDNSPEEKVETVDAIVHQGNDLNREKKQFANKPKAGDNPMATNENVDPLSTLGATLLQKYQSIKLQK